jgi:predicted enzyme related to lactoylglutathione lyase
VVSDAISGRRDVTLPGLPIVPRATLSLFELPATDPRRLAEFFRRVFGWSSREVAWDGPAYLRLEPPDPGRPAGGGILDRAGGEALVDRLTVTIRIEGEDLATTLERVAAAGGTVVLEPTPVGELGSYARFLDPEGNSFGLWRDRRDGRRG